MTLGQPPDAVKMARKKNGKDERLNGWQELAQGELWTEGEREREKGRGERERGERERGERRGEERERVDETTEHYYS